MKRKTLKQLKNIAWYPIVGMAICAFMGLYNIRNGYKWLAGFWGCFAALYAIVKIREINSED